MTPSEKEADRIATAARINGLWMELTREIEGAIIREAISEEMRSTYIVPISREGDDWCVGVMLATAPMTRWQVHRGLARAQAQFGRSIDARHFGLGNEDGASD